MTTPLLTYYHMENNTMRKTEDLVHGIGRVNIEQPYRVYKQWEKILKKHIDEDYHIPGEWTFLDVFAEEIKELPGYDRFINGEKRVCLWSKGRSYSMEVSKFAPIFW